MLTNAPTSKGLKHLLISKHNAKSRVILEKKNNGTDEEIEHYRLRPLTYADTTFLLHPSPITFACLDFMFQNSLLEHSKHGIDIFTHLDELKHVFHLYILLDMMYSIYKQFPECIQVPKRNEKYQDETIEAFENRTFMPLIQNILNCLDNVQYIHRVNKMSEVFIRSLKYDVAVGAVPFVKTTVDLPKPEVNALTLENMMNAYLFLLENAMNSLQVVSLDQIKNNVIVTAKQGIFSCTSFDGTELDLFTYNDSSTSCLSTFRTSLQNIMPLEYELCYANIVNKQNTIEKISKISVIVSSSLSKPLAEAINSATQDGKLSNPSKVINQLTEEKNKVSQMQAKADLIKLQIEKYENLKDADYVGATKQEISNLEELIKLYGKLKPFQPEKEYGLGNLNGTENDTYANIPQRSMINMNPDEMRRFKSGRLHALEEQKLKNEIKELQLQLKRYMRESFLLREEISSKTCINAQLEFEIKKNKIQESINKKKIKDFQTQREDSYKIVEQQNLIIQQMRRMVHDLLGQSQIDKEHRERLMNLFNTKQASDDKRSNIIISKEKLERDLQDLINFFMFGQFLVKKHVKSNNRSHAAYAWATEQIGVRVQPFYGLGYASNALEQYNSYLPQSYMHDRYTYDSEMPSASSVTAPLVSKENRPDMMIYDINARTERDVDIMKNRIKTLTGIQELPEQIYNRQYLNCQFASTQANFEDYLNDALKGKWDVAIKNMLALSPVTFTVTGQRIQPKISIQTVTKYIVPFLTNYIGRSPFSYRIPYILFDVLNANATYYDVKPTDLWINMLKQFYINIS